MPTSKVKSIGAIYRMMQEAVMPYELDTNPENFEELVWEYRKLLIQDRENSWARADLASIAGKTYGKLRRLANETGDSYGYLKQLSYCSKQYDKRIRSLFYKLSFGHFRVVAHLEHRFALLQKAQDESWGVDRLRKEIDPAPLDGVISINRIVRILNSQPITVFRDLDGMSLINLALSPVGKIKWTGKKFEVEELYE